MKDHIEQKENHEKYNGQDNLQALSCAEFEFIFAGPLRSSTPMIADDSLNDRLPLYH
jgi:hypothetical protein